VLEETTTGGKRERKKRNRGGQAAIEKTLTSKQKRKEGRENLHSSQSHIPADEENPNHGQEGYQRGIRKLPKGSKKEHLNTSMSIQDNGGETTNRWGEEETQA